MDVILLSFVIPPASCSDIHFAVTQALSKVVLLESYRIFNQEDAKCTYLVVGNVLVIMSGEFSRKYRGVATY